MKISNLQPIAIVLAAICIGASPDVSLLPEVITPESGNDFITVVNPGGGAAKSRKTKNGNLVAKSSDTGLTNEVWIAVRTDGKNGDGSQRNPFDGSTHAKFDRLIASFGQNTTIHLGSGIFQTDIITRKWRPLNGWKVKGAGMDVTTIQAVGDLSRGGHLYGFGLPNGPSSAVRSDNVTISDLTVDCNWSGIGSSAPVVKGQANCKVGIITLMGSGNVVERVHGKNQYGSFANEQECMGIVMAGFSDGGIVSGNIIRFCVVDSPQGDYSSPYCLTGNGGIESNCEIHDCQAFGRNDGYGFTSTPRTGFISGAVNVANLNDSKIHDNLFADCVYFVYSDTGTTKNVEVYNNRGLRGAGGIGLVNSVASGWRIHDNYIEIQNRSGRGGNYGMIVSGCTNIQIIGNKFVLVPGGHGTGALNGVTISGGSGVFKNNIIDSRLTAGSRVPKTFTITGNRTEKGDLPLGLTEALPLSRD